ncbi:hypothetical protein EZH22_15985 [Xanthobacter dioxanivorans]|uniref:Uncharacterized protein n=1 Tax=Xanthobacter dioxanivorans TaxID=2528964 RepID=A0A974PJZ9_9HYPH|nr:hypothetical protein [Xanthobacter dioxanivorans]QRG04671.1 hypothetical protein EZH22_15985 [Xanthobacter dioxanivorans]
MKSVMFIFGEQTSDEGQDRIGNQILALPGVRTVGRLNPRATKPALRRMWFAEVEDETAAANLVRQLRRHEEVQAADLPAERGLL